MMILSACYTCAGRGPLIEVDHAISLEVDRIDDYIRTVEQDNDTNDLLAAIWPLDRVPACWSVMTVAGRPNGWLLCWIERPHMTFCWEILRPAPAMKKGAADGKAH